MRVTGVQKVLIIQAGSLSKVALSLPLIYAVACANPEVRFTLLVKPSITAILVDLPTNIEAMTLLNYGGKHKVRSMSRLIRLLRQQDLDAIVDVENSAYSRLLSFFTALWYSTQRVTKRTIKYKREKLKQSVSLFEKKENEKQLIKRAFEKLPLNSIKEIKAISPNFEISFLQEELPAVAIKSYTVIVAPFGKSLSPTLQQRETVCNLIQQLLSKFPSCGLALIVQDGEQLQDKIASDNCAFLPCNLLFPIELFILKKAELVIAPESAYLYEAEMVGTEAYCLPESAPYEEGVTQSILKIISNKISQKEGVSLK